MPFYVHKYPSVYRFTRRHAIIYKFIDVFNVATYFNNFSGVIEFRIRIHFILKSLRIIRNIRFVKHIDDSSPCRINA